MSIEKLAITRTMAATMSSYGIIVPASRHYFIVNAQPGEDVDKIMVLNPSPTQALMIHDSGDVCSVMSDGGSAYTTLSMEFTTNHGSVATARFVDGSQGVDDQQPMNIAKFIVLLESRQEDDDHDHWIDGGPSQGSVSASYHRCDILYDIDGEMVMIGISGTHPTSETYMKEAAKEPLGAAKRREKLKNTKYAAACAKMQTRFHPFVFETSGGLTGTALLILDKISQHADVIQCPYTSDEVRTILRHQIAVAIARWNCQIILAFQREMADRARKGPQSIAQTRRRQDRIDRNKSNSAYMNPHHLIRSLPFVEVGA